VFSSMVHMCVCTCMQVCVYVCVRMCVCVSRTDYEDRTDSGDAVRPCGPMCFLNVDGSCSRMCAEYAFQRDFSFFCTALEYWRRFFFFFGGFIFYFFFLKKILIQNLKKHCQKKRGVNSSTGTCNIPYGDAFTCVSFAPKGRCYDFNVTGCPPNTERGSGVCG
jgi:hypothetical protein